MNNWLSTVWKNMNYNASLRIHIVKTRNLNLIIVRTKAYYMIARTASPRKK